MHGLILQFSASILTIGHALSAVANVLANVAPYMLLAPPAPPIDPTGLIDTLTTFALKVLMAIAGLWVVIDMFKHVTASPRDLKTAGIELMLMGAMIAVAAKSGEIITWAKGAL